MPLIYGEGDAAFQRLQKKVIKQSNDQTIFAWGFSLPDEITLLAGYPLLTSILADSPAQFEGCGDIVSYDSSGRPINHSEYQLVKDGIRMIVSCDNEKWSLHRSVVVGVLFCYLESQKSRIGIRLQPFTEDKKSLMYHSLIPHFLGIPRHKDRTHDIFMDRVAGCKSFLWSSSKSTTFKRSTLLTTNPPQTLNQAQPVEGSQGVLVSPYGTVIILKLENLILRPLLGVSRAQIRSEDGYFVVNHDSTSYREHNTFGAFFACLLEHNGTARATSTTLYMMVDYYRPVFSWIIFLDWILPYPRQTLPRCRCRFAKSELEVEDLSSEGLHSLSWTSTITCQDTAISTCNINKKSPGPVSLLGFKLNRHIFEPPPTILNLCYPVPPEESIMERIPLPTVTS